MHGLSQLYSRNQPVASSSGKIPCWQNVGKGWNSFVINHLKRECKVTLKLYTLIGFAVSLISTAAKKHSVHVCLSYLTEHHFNDTVLLLYGEIQGNVLLNNLKGKMSYLQLSSCLVSTENGKVNTSVKTKT